MYLFFLIFQPNKPILITIISTDQKVNTKYLCKKSVKFIYIEQKLYQKYPQCRNANNTFLVNGGKVDKNISLKDNNIHDGDVITLWSQ